MGVPVFEQLDEVRDVLAHASPAACTSGSSSSALSPAIIVSDQCRELLAVLHGETEHLRDHDQRQRLGDVVDEVAFAARRDVVDQLARERRGCAP